MNKGDKGNKYFEIYEKLNSFFGQRSWWPTVSKNPKLEICFGAILTQNTAWLNVEKAIKNLEESSLIDVEKIRNIKTKRLASLIKPAGYYNQKAKKLKLFCDFLTKNYGSDLNKLFSLNIEELRKELLGIKGIGNETADSIILYSAGKPLFVVDAYTKRVFSRIGLTKEKGSYEEIQKQFMNNLPENTELFNNFHALIVEQGKTFCRKKPRCDSCPLKNSCNQSIQPNI